jgi:hypothetical protein
VSAAASAALASGVAVSVSAQATKSAASIASQRDRRFIMGSKTS